MNRYSAILRHRSRPKCIEPTNTGTQSGQPAPGPSATTVYSPRRCVVPGTARPGWARLATVDDEDRKSPSRPKIATIDQPSPRRERGWVEGARSVDKFVISAPIVRHFRAAGSMGIANRVSLMDAPCNVRPLFPTNGIPQADDLWITYNRSAIESSTYARLGTTRLPRRCL